MKGRRAKKNNKMTEYLILIIIIFFTIKEYKENKLGKIESDYWISKTKIEIYENKVIGEEKKIEKSRIEYPKEEILDNYKGYKVSAKLEIPVISLETYVISEFSTNALNISVTKFWGPNPNEIGNYCVAGHNFRNKNMFRNLKKLKIDDEIWLTDKKIGKVKYKVYEIYQVVPTDVSCLNQNTESKEITLITCTSDSKRRIIIKAKEDILN